MTWLQFIDSMVGRVAWPIVVLIVIFAVRRHLGSLAERILELSFGGATVKFDKLLSKGAEIIEQAPLAEAPVPQPELPPPATETAKPPFIQAPPGAGKTRASVTNILVAFEAIESLMTKIADAIGVKARGITLVRVLISRSLVPDDVLDLYTTLREGRNASVHSSLNPTKEQVNEYIRQALYLLDNLQLALARVQDNKNKP